MTPIIALVWILSLPPFEIHILYHLNLSKFLILFRFQFIIIQNFPVIKSINANPLIVLYLFNVR